MWALQYHLKILYIILRCSSKHDLLARKLPLIFNSKYNDVRLVRAWSCLYMDNCKHQNQLLYLSFIYLTPICSNKEQDWWICYWFVTNNVILKIGLLLTASFKKTFNKWQETWERMRLVCAAARSYKSIFINKVKSLNWCEKQMTSWACVNIPQVIEQLWGNLLA